MLLYSDVYAADPNNTQALRSQGVPTAELGLALYTHQSTTVYRFRTVGQSTPRRQKK